MNIAFWNVGTNPIASLAGQLCEENDIDILILAECTETVPVMISALNGGGLSPVYHEFLNGFSTHIRMFTRYPQRSLKAVTDNGRISIRHLQPPLGEKILIVGAHLLSKYKASEEDQFFEAEVAREVITAAEQKVGHQNTLVIGDLNMHPFEAGMVAARGFHAVQDKNIARKMRRAIGGVKYDYFYNPMWSKMGDESDGPPGTYYYTSGNKSIKYFWGCYDQVLLRPKLLEYYSNTSLKIVTDIKGASLLHRSGAINKNISDHLPLTLSLNIERTISGKLLAHT